jgi:arylsulfatase A-like enzyme
MTDPASDSRTPPGWRAAVPLALAAGLAAGWFELGVIAVRRFARSEMVFTGWQAVWTTPLSAMLWMLPPGLAVAVAARFAPRLVPRFAVVFAPVFVAAFSAGFLFYPSLHAVAIMVLAAGIASAVAQRLAPRLAAAARAGLGIAAAGIAGVAVAAAVVHGGRMIAERHRVAALPPAARGAPDVLLVVLDAVRAQNLSLHGYPDTTDPVLRRLAARGAHVTHAYATAPWTLVSHATLFTGRYPHELAADWEVPLDPGIPTLADAFNARGYRTAGFAGNNAYCGRETGLDRGFAHYEDYTISAAELLTAASLGRIVLLNPRLRDVAGYHDIPGRRTAARLTDAYLRWRDGVRDRPTFAFLNLYDAHEPYLPPSPFDSAFAPPVPRRNAFIRMMNAHMAERAFKRSMDSLERRAEERAYDGGVAYMDAELGRLFAELDRRGRLANTIVAVTADHGELFGEHGLFSHGNSLYLPLLHVPLVVTGPGVPAGKAVGVPVTLRDLPATLLALAGAGAALPGTPLLPAALSGAPTPSPIVAEVRPAANQDERYPSTRGIMHSAVDATHQLIVNGDGREELYALSDTVQATDLTGRPEAAADLARLRAVLAAAGVRR